MCVRSIMLALVDMLVLFCEFFVNARGMDNGNSYVAGATAPSRPWPPHSRGF